MQKYPPPPAMTCAGLEALERLKRESDLAV